MRYHSVLASTLALGLFFVIAQSTPSDAGRKRHGTRGVHTITVESNYTADRVTGAVRRGPRGPEVQLPGGSWIPCHLGCAYTLRTQTIDFWFWIDEISHP